MVRITIDETRCKGCGLCARACPKHIIELAKSKLNPKGYHPAEVIDIASCVACAACARTCPDIAIHIEKE